jgi:hypothetical protein
MRITFSDGVIFEQHPTLTERSFWRQAVTNYAALRKRAQYETQSYRK